MLCTWIALLTLSLATARQEDIATRTAQAWTASNGTPDEALRVATVAFEEFDGSDDPLVVELAYLVGFAHHAAEHFAPAIEAYDVAEERSLSNAGHFHERILLRRSLCKRLLGDYAGALEDLDIALELEIVRERPSNVAIVANERGIIRTLQGETELAIDSWRQALEAFETMGDMASVSLVLGNLGILHGNLGQYQESIDCIERSLQLSDANVGGASRARNLLNLGQSYGNIGKVDVAREMIEEAIELFEGPEREQGLAAAYGNLAALHLRLEEYDAALVDFRAAEEIWERLGLEGERAAGLAHIADVLTTLEQHEEAAAHSRESLELSRSVDSKRAEIEALKALARSEEATGAFEAALKHFRRVQELEKDVYSEESKLEMERVHAELETKRRDQELALQQAELDQRVVERNAFIAGAILFLVAAGAGWSLVLVRRRAHRELTNAFETLQESNQQVLQREAELRDALSRIRRLEGLLPICAECKSIRDTEGSWHPLELFIKERSEAEFTHGWCPTCAAEVRSLAEARKNKPETSSHDA